MGRRDRHSNRLAPPDSRWDDLDAHAIRIDSGTAQLLGEELAERGSVSAKFTRVSRGLNGRSVLRQPSLKGRSELEDREEERHEHRDGEGRLERRQASVVMKGPRQRTACIWLTRAWRRATSPLFHAVTPMTSVPRTTAAPMMYSIAARPSLAEYKRRSTDMNLPRGWGEARFGASSW